jgi:hypothetical protein
MPTKQKSYDEKLIKKIKGLLDTSEKRGASEAEAASAARLVEGLLLKHGLDRKDVEDEAERLDEDVEALGMILGTEPESEYLWMIQLGVATSLLCFCRMVLTRTTIGNEASLAFVGSQTDARGAFDLFAYLLDRGKYLADQEAEKTTFKGVLQIGQTYIMTERDKDLFVKSFLIGYSQRVAHMIAVRIAERDQEDAAMQGKITALAENRMANADEWLQKQFGTMPKRDDFPSVPRIDHDALMRGDVAGRAAQLSVAKEIEA